MKKYPSIFLIVVSLVLTSHHAALYSEDHATAPATPAPIFLGFVPAKDSTFTLHYDIHLTNSIAFGYGTSRLMKTVDKIIHFAIRYHVLIPACEKNKYTNQIQAQIVEWSMQEDHRLGNSTTFSLNISPDRIKVLSNQKVLLDSDVDKNNPYYLKWLPALSMLNKSGTFNVTARGEITSIQGDGVLITFLKKLTPANQNGYLFSIALPNKNVQIRDTYESQQSIKSLGNYKIQKPLEWRTQYIIDSQDPEKQQLFIQLSEEESENMITMLGQHAFFNSDTTVTFNYLDQWLSSITAPNSEPPATVTPEPLPAKETEANLVSKKEGSPSLPLVPDPIKMLPDASIQADHSKNASGKWGKIIWDYQNNILEDVQYTSTQQFVFNIKPTGWDKEVIQTEGNQVSEVHIYRVK